MNVLNSLADLESDECLSQMGLDVRIDEDSNGFELKVRPHPDLWLSSPVTFHVELPEGFPKVRPTVLCTSIDPQVRSDPRLLVVVPPTKVALSVSSSDSSESSESESNSSEEEDQPQLYKSRIEKDGSVHSNLFESQYMGWLEFYDIRVIFHSLRLLFMRSDFELAPRPSRWARVNPLKLSVSSGVHEEQGPRTTMEDRVCMEDFHFVAHSLDQAGAETPGIFSGGNSRIDIDENKAIGSPAGRHVAFHAVFDGHGGYKAADTASLLLDQFFFDQLIDSEMGINRALYNAVLQTEETLAKQAMKEKEQHGYILNTSGTTLCAIAIDLDLGILCCANVGDSRAILCRHNGTAFNLSEDHKASRPDEVARVVHTGGFVSYGRVLGMLAVSRALGDPEMKTPNPLISAVPSMTQMELRPGDNFVLIACDGVFDVMSSQEAIDFVSRAMNTRNIGLDQICQELVHHVLGTLGSQDNVSVVIVKFNFMPSSDSKIQHFKSASASSNKLEETTEMEARDLPSVPLVTTHTEAVYLSPKVKAAVRASRLRKHATHS